MMPRDCVTYETIRKLQPSQVLGLFDEEIDRLSPRAARAMRQLFEGVRNRVDAEELARLVRLGDLRGIERLLRINPTDPEAEEFAKAINRAVRVAAQKSRDTMEEPKTLEGNVLAVDVNATPNPRLEQYAATMTATRIRAIDQQTRDLLRDTIRVGSVQGDDPFAIARRLRGNIGLTARQAQAVANYERNLRTNDPYALQRELRDRRSDGPVRRAIRGERQLSEAQIQSLVDRYRDRWLKYRSQVIGRTETIRAVQGAQWELIQSYIDSGQIDERQVRREWITTPDDRLRDAHAMIPVMNEGGVGQNEPFRSPLGPIMYPGDPSAPAENTIQCRCAVFVRIVDPELLGLRAESRPTAGQPQGGPAPGGGAL